MSIVKIVSLHRKLKHKKKKKLKLSILVRSCGCQTQSPPSDGTPRQMGYVGAWAKARAIHLLWYTC